MSNQKLTLFFTPDTIALAVLIVLEELGVDYELKRISFAQNEQKSEPFVSVNPKARVPALFVPAKNAVLTETPAILAYLASLPATAASLWPSDDAFDAARVHEFMAYLCSTVHVSRAHMKRGARWSDDPQVS